MAKRKELKDMTLKQVRKYEEIPTARPRYDIVEVTVLRKWQLAKVMACCPNKTPDSLGASPTRCDVCEQRITDFNLKGKNLK